MIEQTLLEIIRQDINDMTVTKNYRTSDDNYIVVYDMGSDPIDRSDETMYYTGVYQIEIGSSDFDKAKKISYQVFDTLNYLNYIDIDTNLFSIEGANIDKVTLISMSAERLPSLLGVEDDVMIYTLTYQAPIVIDCNN